MSESEKSKNLLEYQGNDRVVSSIELDLEFRKITGPTFSLKSRIPTLDKLIAPGFQGGELYVISGPTKNGKTLLAQSLTVAFVKQQIYPLWFSFEVPARQFLSQFPEVPLFYLPAKLKPYTMPWLFERIREGQEKFGTRVIFIDHLHFLFDMARATSPSIEIGTIIRKLKSLAVQEDLIIFLLCHTTKGKHEDNLSYESIRDSSFVSQESDCVLLIRREPKRGTNEAGLVVSFHRRTGVLEQKINLRKEGGYLIEPPERKEVAREEGV